MPSTKKTASLVQEIASASAEQSVGADQISSSMTQLASTTQMNASASEELAATAEELSSQASQLRELMAVFSIADAGHAGPRPAHLKRVAEASRRDAVASHADFRRFD